MTPSKEKRTNKTRRKLNKTRRKLTSLIPMKLNNGFAVKIRITAWMRPRAPPIINADEADDICLFLIPPPIISA